MAIGLFLLGALVWLIAGVSYSQATTVFQQVVAAVIGVSGTVLIVGGCIVDRLNTLLKPTPGAASPSPTEDPFPGG